MQSADEARARRAEVIVAGCYIANWPNVHQTLMPTLGHTWSLSVEEQFYLLWPILLYSMLRLRLSRRIVLLLVCTGVLISALHRRALFDLHKASGSESAITFRLYVGSDTRADVLLIGCLVGLLVSWDMMPRSRRFVAWIKIASIACVMERLSYLCSRRALVAYEIPPRSVYRGRLDGWSHCRSLAFEPIWVESPSAEVRAARKNWPNFVRSILVSYTNHALAEARCLRMGASCCHFAGHWPGHVYRSPDLWLAASKPPACV